MALINVRNSAHVMTLVQSLVYAYVVTLTVAVLAVGIRLRYLAIFGEDSSTNLLGWTNVFQLDKGVSVCGKLPEAIMGMYTGSIELLPSEV